MIIPKTVVTPCSGGDCVAITAIGADWFRIFSTVLPTVQPSAMVAVDGNELRAFIDAVKAGAFDELAALPRSA
jgi:hypothetical protein